MRTNVVRWIPLILAAASAISLGGYLLFASRQVTPGFPLDDAWIHQTYARSLGINGEWTFLPGKPSAGSTAPLWTGLLSLGYILRTPPVVFSAVLGLVCLAWLAFLIQKYSITNVQAALPWAGLLICFEWHFVWAALSGMETLLFALACTAVIAPMAAGGKSGFWQFLICGAAVWVRPEGLTLLVPLFLTLLFNPGSWLVKIRQAALSLGGFALIIAPYLYLNWRLSGSPLPNTFYAKQAEYAALLSSPFLKRLWGEVLPVLTGAGALLAPGFIMFIINAVRRRVWGGLWAAGWWFGTVLLYSLRMPVTYQHGRYLIPSMPVYILLGILGTKDLLLRLNIGLAGRVFRRALLFSLGLVLVGFWILGADAYRSDTAIINTEMVAASQWINAKTPQSAVVAAHDIGALGYYGGRDIIDLAGLINPDVIQLINDESALAEYLTQKDPDYLMTFPGWYTDLTESLSPLFCTDSEVTRQAGGENMCIYAWQEK